MLAYLKAHGELLITLSAIIGGLGILITINGNRFNAQDKLIAQGLDAQERLMNQRFDRLTDEIADLRGIMVGVSERVSRNEGEIDVIREHPAHRGHPFALKPLPPGASE